MQTMVSHNAVATLNIQHCYLHKHYQEHISAVRSEEDMFALLGIANVIKSKEYTRFKVFLTFVRLLNLYPLLFMNAYSVSDQENQMECHLKS